jgi:glucose/arabinose dehydrogenase
MTIKRYRVSWSNFPGAPGVSTHYFDPAVTDFTPVKTFYASLAARVPFGLTFTFPNTVDVIDEKNGQIQITSNATVLSPETSNVTAANYSGTSGLAIQWRTPDYVDGNHVVGRTYLVPLGPTFYDTNGSIGSATISAVQTAATTLLTAMPMVVWSRPRKAGPGGNPSARDGSSHAITAALVPDVAVVMRSRRI